MASPETSHKMTIDHADVVIVGGGAIGLATAYFLATHKKACSIAVIERDLAYRLASTPRASGGVRRLFALPENIELSQFSIPFFGKFSDLMEVDGQKPDIALRKNGYLFIVPPGEVSKLERNFERQRALGCNVEWLDPPALKTAYPSMHVDDLGSAVRSPDDGWLDPHSVLMGFRNKVRSLGVKLVTDEVTAIQREGHLIRSVTLASGAKINTAYVVNAAGAWSGRISALVGMDVPIMPLRRYEHYFECEEPIEPLPYLKDLQRLAFRPEGRGYSGGVPTLDEPRGFNFEADHTYFENVVWPALAHRFPQFERTKCKATLPGLYDQNDFDGNAIIGPWSGECPNFLMNAGYSGHGLMHAPGSGRAIAELILDGSFQTLDLTALGWNRVVEGRPYREAGII
ncbi:Glycine/D-amino acid oxidase [Rhizobiales bacterium GAS191]|nr:Glycine/D-amino acid oxidase [Rhizobiales bacterium GAS113]SED01580.1 Glycine/D-amino acid oxidase [Rhizobiales bacterium GAS191]